jgi:gluconolactonase
VNAGTGTGGANVMDGGASSHVSLAALVCPADASYDVPPAGTRTAQLVQDGFGFLEGPVWIAARGVLLFSDMDFSAPDDNGPPSRIRRLTPPSSFDVFVEEANTNGLALLPPGNALGSGGDESVLGCAHDVRSLAIVELSSARTPLALTFAGKQFNSPNDLTVRSDGTVYFSDPDWQLGPRTAQIGFTGVFRVRLGVSDEVELVSDMLDKPNGVALSPDERTLYVGSSGTDVLAFPVAADGSTGTPSVFASPGSTDGMGMDCAGNLYVASGMQVHVFAPDGHELYAIDVAQTPSNVAFGGADRKTLYVTAGSGLYAIDLEIPGLPY